MKKIFLLRMVIAITALMFNSHLPAQTAIPAPPFTIADAGMHNTLLAELKEKSVRSFNHFVRAYPEAIVQGIRNEKDGTRINAKLHGDILKVHYDVKGKFESGLLYYPFDKLDEKIADRVMAAYPGFIVFGVVIDVTVGDKSALLVMVENRKSWKRVRITNDAMDVFEEYVKAAK